MCLWNSAENTEIPWFRKWCPPHYWMIIKRDISMLKRSQIHINPQSDINNDCNQHCCMLSQFSFPFVEPIRPVKSQLWSNPVILLPVESTRETSQNLLHVSSGHSWSLYHSIESWFSSGFPILGLLVIPNYNKNHQQMASKAASIIPLESLIIAK